MTEEREQYQWETEDSTGTAVVPDAQREPSLEERVAELEALVSNCESRLDTQSQLNRVRAEIFTARLNKLQDANLAPMLESSAVIVELRRIADAQERQASALEWIANGFGSNGETGWLRTANDGRTDRDLSS